MMTFGSIPALLNAKRERLFNVIFCPLRTIIAIGADSGEIVPFLMQNPFQNGDIDD